MQAATTLLTTALALMSSIPSCDVPIYIAAELPRNSLGMSDGEVILLSRQLRTDEIEWVVTHECGHVLLHHANGRRYLRHFRGPSYVSDYAKVSPDESFAEEFADFIINGDRDTRRHRIIKRLLAH